MYIIYKYTPYNYFSFCKQKAKGTLFTKKSYFCRRFFNPIV